MLSIKPLKSAQGAYDYYTKAFDYYAGDATAMQWLGRGAEMLRLGNVVQKEQLLPLLQGRLPSGEKLPIPTILISDSEGMSLPISFFSQFNSIN